MISFNFIRNFSVYFLNFNRSFFWSLGFSMASETLRFSVLHPVVRLLTHISCDAIFFSQWTDFNETQHKYSPCEWTSLKMFPKSKVRSQGHDQTYWFPRSDVQTIVNIDRVRCFFCMFFLFFPSLFVLFALLFVYLGTIYIINTYPMTAQAYISAVWR